MIDFSKQRAAAKWNEDVERRKRSSRYIDYYRNNQTEHLTDILHELYPKEWDMMSKYATTYALTRAMIDDMALVFQTPADIGIEANDAQQDKLAALIDQSHLPTRLIQADRYAELLNKVGICPRWHTDQKYIVLDLITPDRCIVEQDPQDHAKAIVVKYFLSEMENTPNGMDSGRWAVWTADEYREVRLGADGQEIGETLKAEPNPYKRIPIAWFTTSAELDEFWPDEGSSIVAANEVVNLRLTNLQIMLDYQAFSTLVTKGLPESQTIPWGVTHRLNIPYTTSGDMIGGAEYITPSPKITEYWEITNQYITNVARLNGLSAQSFSRDASSFTSGYQLKLSKQDIINRNVLKREFYRESVRELVILMMECYSINNNFRFPPDPEVLIDFADIAFESNPLEQEQLYAMQLSNGTIDRVQILMNQNPDLTEEMAEEALAKIQERNARRNTTTTNNLNAALGVEDEDDNGTGETV
jgi:hypothetical protein